MVRVCPRKPLPNSGKLLQNNEKNTLKPFVSICTCRLSLSSRALGSRQTSEPPPHSTTTLTTRHKVLIKPCFDTFDSKDANLSLISFRSGIKVLGNLIETYKKIYVNKLQHLMGVVAWRCSVTKIDNRLLRWFGLVEIMIHSKTWRNRFMMLV